MSYQSKIMLSVKFERCCDGYVKADHDHTHSDPMTVPLPWLLEQEVDWEGYDVEDEGIDMQEADQNRDPKASVSANKKKSLIPN